MYVPRGQSRAQEDEGCLAEAVAGLDLGFGVLFTLQQNLMFYFFDYIVLKTHFGASLVAQWLRIRLPVQGTRVRALVQEDPACRGATKPVRHNY